MSFAHHSLCGSVIEHQNTESKGLRFDCLWELTRLQDYISMTVFLLNCFFQKTLNIPSYQFLAALPCTSHRLYSLCSLFWCGSGSKWLICYDVTETHSQDPKCVFYLLNKESRVIVKNKSLKKLISQLTINNWPTVHLTVGQLRLIGHTSLFKRL